MRENMRKELWKRMFYRVLTMVLVLGFLWMGGVLWVWGGKVLSYQNKRLDGRLGLWDYKDKDKILGDLKGEKIYYKVYEEGGKVRKEEKYIEGELVNYYKYEYNVDGKVGREEFYDNGILIQARIFYYGVDGLLRKIESQGRNEERNGDSRYFDEKGDIRRLERYRRNKLSYIKRFEGGKLRESHYYVKGFVELTKYNEEGRVLYEKSIDEKEFSKEEVFDQGEGMVIGGWEEIERLVLVDRDKGKKVILDNERDMRKLMKESGFRLKVYKKVGLMDLSPERYGVLDVKREVRLERKNGRVMKVLVGNLVSERKGYIIVLNAWGNHYFLMKKEEVDKLFERSMGIGRVLRVIGNSANGGN